MDTPYVSAATALVVREFEQRFLDLRKDSGILFVSVEADRAVGGAGTKFHIRLGVSKDIPVSAGVALIQTVMRKEIEAGFNIQAEVFRGVRGP